MEKKSLCPCRDAKDPRYAGPGGPRRTGAAAAGATAGRGLSEWAGVATAKRGDGPGEADRNRAPRAGLVAVACRPYSKRRKGASLSRGKRALRTPGTQYLTPTNLVDVRA